MQQNINVKFDELINNIQDKNERLESTNKIRNNLNKVEPSTSNTNESCNDNVVLDKELINNNDVVENNENNNVIESIISESTDELVGGCLLYTSGTF